MFKKTSFVFLLFLVVVAALPTGIVFGKARYCYPYGPYNRHGWDLAGFGEKCGVASRGQSYIAEAECLWSLGLHLKDPGSADLRIVLAEADENGFPKKVLKERTIPNKMLSKRFIVYKFLFRPLKIGSRYIFYLEPSKDGKYCDDYRDLRVNLKDPYPLGKGVLKIENVWYESDQGNLDLRFTIRNRVKVK